MRIFAAPLLLLLTSCATQLFGWGCEGHAMVALIARAHLTPAASASTDLLLRENPIDPALSRFCKDRPADLMADAATWADDSRTIEKTSLWHYIDIPLTVNTGGLDPWCPPIGPPVNGKERAGCVTNAVEYEWAALRDRQRPAAERATALRYIIHFIADMHQPLHDSDNLDRGGNCTVMTFFGDPKPVNLHAIWDYRILARSIAAKNATLQEYASAIDEQYASHWPDWGSDRIDVDAWAWEGHKLAVDNTYGQLHPAIPFESAKGTTDCDAEKSKVAALQVAIGDAYYNTALPVINQQIAKAGYRLAAILNQTF